MIVIATYYYKKQENPKLNVMVCRDAMEKYTKLALEKSKPARIKKNDSDSYVLL